MTAFHLVRCFLPFVLLFTTHVNATTGSKLQEWINARCGPEGHAIWMYEGSLSDPLTGQRIARVEGVEIVRLWGRTEPQQDPTMHQSRCQSLSAAVAEIPRAESAATIVSRRLFCYRPLEEENGQGLLREIRLRPTSPVRKIPLDQAVTVYDSATTFLEPHEKKPFWYAHTQGKGHALWTKAFLDEETSDREVALSIYGRPQTPLQQERLKPDWDKDASSDTTNEASQPARSAVIQFGASPDQEKSKYGARETYHYTLPDKAEPEGHTPLSRAAQRRRKQLETVDSRGRSVAQRECRVRYTRYGEGPVWYGPGRLCTLELHGRRVEQQKARMPSKLVAEALPTFWSSPSPVEDGEAARELERLFEQPIALPAWEEEGMNWRDRVGETAGKIIQRLRSASWSA